MDDQRSSNPVPADAQFDDDSGLRESDSDQEAAAWSAISEATAVDGSLLDDDIAFDAVFNSENATTSYPPDFATLSNLRRRNEARSTRTALGTGVNEFGPPMIPSDSSDNSDNDPATPNHTTSIPISFTVDFLDLPPELIDAVLSYLSPYTLVALSSTCKALRRHALSNVHWYKHVQENVPGITIASPGPCADYHQLYAAHDRLWFLPKYKIWFCDRDLMGKMIVVRYDPRRGCIEGYQLLAERRGKSRLFELGDRRVHIYNFEPHVKLHLDKPVIQFRAQKTDAERRFVSRPGANRYADEMPMELDDRMDAVFSNFLFAKALSPVIAQENLTSGFPYGSVWPPPAIPAQEHVSGVNSVLDVPEITAGDLPHRRSEVSDQTFRIRQWMEMAGSPAAPHLVRRRYGDNAITLAPAVMPLLAGVHNIASMGGASLSGIHIGEELITYATLDPALYTPTPLRPWRGIWVGDYVSHGCEFLLMNQPDDPPATDTELDLVRTETETDEQWEQRRNERRIYRGRLEAVKLTGDPNVPRGEYTFVANDLGPDGYVRRAIEPPFDGARVVRSQGHVANVGFADDKYMECELILISHDRIAQHWVDFNHVSYFQRVDIDSFLAP